MKYRIGLGWFLDAKIEEVEITRETESSIWLVGCKTATRKKSSYYRYCDTWEEAYEILDKIVERRFQSAKEALVKAHGIRAAVRRLKNDRV